MTMNEHRVGPRQLLKFLAESQGQEVDGAFLCALSGVVC